jgi:hypothetical protein
MRRSYAVTGIVSVLLLSSCATEPKTVHVVLDGDLTYAVDEYGEFSCEGYALNTGDGTAYGVEIHVDLIADWANGGVLYGHLQGLLEERWGVQYIHPGERVRFRAHGHWDQLQSTDQIREVSVWFSWRDPEHHLVGP